MSATEASATYRQLVADGISPDHALTITIALIHQVKPHDRTPA